MGEGYLRLCFANSDEIILEGVRRIKAFVTKEFPWNEHTSVSPYPEEIPGLPPADIAYDNGEQSDYFCGYAAGKRFSGSRQGSGGTAVLSNINPAE